jgi:pilus assembly protein CpaD
MTAEVGPCGLWPHDLAPSLGSGSHENREYWNLGCASQRNMAAMAANPADLVQPREEAPISAARRSTVLGKWQKGEPTATQDPNAGKGKISDVGQ